MRIFLYVCFLIGIQGIQVACARQPNEEVLKSLITHFRQFTAEDREPDLFLHVDKQVYTPNENIWFTGYILNPDSMLAHHTLHCILVEEATRQIVASEQFVIDGGLAGGAVFLPDSLRGGNYRLIAYTNTWLFHPGQYIFEQSVTLKTKEDKPFRFSFQPHLYRSAGDAVQFGYKITTGREGLAVGAVVSYGLLADGVAIQQSKIKVDAFGEMRLALTRQQVIGKRIELQATITRQQEKQSVSIPVPLLEEVASIRLYPEGGNLVHGHATSVGVEIRNGFGKPIAAGGWLLEEGRRIDSFTTDRDGMGMIGFTPHRNKKYTVQLSDTAWQPVYDFPSVSAYGYSLHLANAVVRDSILHTEIGVPAVGDTCHLIAHNYRQVYFSATLVVKDRRAALQMPVADMPQGVVTLTLFNTAGAPQVERAIYIDKGEQLQVSMSTDSAVYHHRSKLRLKVKVTNGKGQPVQAFFSLACVLNNRLDAGHMADITRFYRFGRFLPSGATLPAATAINSHEYIERLLLTRYWTRYKWEQINTAQGRKLFGQENSVTGRVSFNKLPVRKPVPMVVMGGVSPYIFSTDAKGYFELPHQALRMAAGQKLIVAPAGKNRLGNYLIQLFSKWGAADSALASRAYPPVDNLKAELTVQEQQYLEKAMKAVVVTARKQDDIHFLSGAGRTNCYDDWVCMFNVLNCPGHPDGVPPVYGRAYYSPDPNGPRMVVYRCELRKGLAGDFVKELNGVSYPREFYVADYDRFNPAVPEVMSTVFWSYKTLTDEAGEAEIRFSTNDLSGIFSCILQGWGGQGPVSGKASFRVVE